MVSCTWVHSISLQDARLRGGRGALVAGCVYSDLNLADGCTDMSVEVPHGRGVQVGDGNVQVNVFPDRPQTVGAVVVGNVPQAPLALQPRAELLGALRSAGPGVSLVRAVTGMRGVGKTQVAAAYARECIDAGWRLVAWVNAEGSAEALGGLAVIADRLEITQPNASVEAIGHRVRGWLESDGAYCLVVFDNVTALTALRPYLPAAGKSQVVLNSSSTLSLGKPVTVDVFTDVEALAFLAERTGLNDPEGARELSRELGWLPLALAQAAAAIAAQHLSFGVYLERLRSFPLRDYLAPVDGESYPRGLAEAILLSLDGVRDADRTGLCGDLLDLVAVLSPAGVSRALLHTAGQPGILPRLADPPEIDEALGRLATSSLLSFSDDGTSVTTHRLVARVARERHAHEGTLADVAVKACRLLDRAAAVIDEAWRNRAAVREAVSHIIALTEDIRTGLDDDSFATDFLALRAWALWALNDLGDYSKAIDIGESLFPGSERRLGEMHPVTLTRRHNLAFAYRVAGRVNEAVSLFEQVVDGRAWVLGDEHPDTLISRNQLAVGYRAAGPTPSPLGVSALSGHCSPRVPCVL